jgi:hypothetical protein
MGSMGDPILMGNSWKNVADFFDFSARSGDLPSNIDPAKDGVGRIVGVYLGWDGFI